MSHSADGASAPVPRRRFPPQPIDPAIRKRRIKIARAFNLICRTKCAVAVALRATGLDHDWNARQDVADLLDRKGISRRRRGVRRIMLPETPSRNFETFIPRQPLSQREIAEMVAELREIADLLGDDVARADRARDADRHVLEKKAAKPKPPRICASCGGAFEGQRNAKFCGGACRIRSWRAQQ
jgi:hypothetical protein